MNEYFAVYSKDRKIIVCKHKSKQVPSTRSFRRKSEIVFNSDENYEPRVLKTRKGQTRYLNWANKQDNSGYEIVKVDQYGRIIED